MASAAALAGAARRGRAALHRTNGLLCGVSPDIMRVALDEDGERLMISTAGIWQAHDLLATMGDATVRGSALADVELHLRGAGADDGRDRRCPIRCFTMGVLAYELATASRPYDGASMPALLGAMLRGAPGESARTPADAARGRVTPTLKALSRPARGPPPVRQGFRSRALLT